MRWGKLLQVPIKVSRVTMQIYWEMSLSSPPLFTESSTLYSVREGVGDVAPCKVEVDELLMAGVWAILF